MKHCLDKHWSDLLEWLSQPHIIAIITAWWITFTLVATIVLCFGFGPSGVVAGSLAATFQSFMYGGFTPAGGIFATLTSMAMLGTLAWPVAIFATLVATGVATGVWAYGVGR
ncbi:hypothetical protein BS50DRAFT_509338 [Corynespora cassiicola Philippines]|uniref:Uncharacterized protein n=1 Tax=Corynespora cassiicola Philippines TaxID=1448308 RepID=A0A2T2N0W7_CORCC|nr:hypothetical protein BS50DRAFT_509338 [Corynespora cassiicola Philippines]